jgi:PQQ enzyme-like repeat protein
MNGFTVSEPSRPGLLRRLVGGRVGLSRRASGQLFALDARSGEILWLGSPREAENVALAKSSDLLFLLKKTTQS